MNTKSDRLPVPDSLMKVLRCLRCSSNNLRMEEDNRALQCGECGARYHVHNGIPSMLNGGPEQQDWNPWDLDTVQMMGESYYKRAKGELPEKESSLSCARLMKNRSLYNPGETVLDLGCATGHFLRSFRRILDQEIRYTGIDATSKYLQWGQQVFGVNERTTFLHGDVLSMPFVDNAFDTVFVNLFHFFPRADVPLRESMRVARKRVLWRTPLAEVNYIVRVVYSKSFDDVGILTPDRKDVHHSLYMLYTKEYVEGLIRHLGGKVLFLDRDTDFGEFDNTKLEGFEHVTATKVVNGMQINGNLVLDWHYVAIDSSGD